MKNYVDVVGIDVSKLTLDAHIHKKACREVYERIVGKGKSKKLALIAVSNKLVKQAFAIAKSGRPYDEMHISVLTK